jgi:hypothetical protein
MEITKESWLQWARGNHPRLHKYLQEMADKKLDDAIESLMGSGVNILFECVKYYDAKRINLLKRKLEDTFFNRLLLDNVDSCNIFMIAMEYPKDTAFMHITELVEE